MPTVQIKVGDLVAVPTEDSSGSAWQAGKVTSITPDRALAYVEMQMGAKKGHVAVKLSTLKRLLTSPEENSNE